MGLTGLAGLAGLGGLGGFSPEFLNKLKEL